MKCHTCGNHSWKSSTLWHNIAKVLPCGTVANGDQDSVSHAVVVEPGDCRIELFEILDFLWLHEQCQDLVRFPDPLVKLGNLTSSQ